MSNFPSRSDLEKRIIVGVDEFNNGRSHPEVPFICVAYTGIPQESSLETSIKKGKGFCQDKKAREKFKAEALEYLKEHNSFRYFAIEPSEDPVWFGVRRTGATARLIYESVKSIIDKDPIVLLDGSPYHEHAVERIEDMLDDYGLSVDFHFKKRGDTNYLPVRIADRIAYCLGALRYGGGRKKWPYRAKKIDFNRLPEVLLHRGGFKH